MLKTNSDKLIKMSVLGEITAPAMSIPYRVTAEGDLKVFPGTGGITYNARIGDDACGWQADHVEPGVTIRNPKDVYNSSLNILSCAGNIATVVTGECKGKTGFVTGKHGGCEHVLIDFEPKVLEKLVIGDKIQIQSYGVGLELAAYPEVKVFNISPDLLSKIDIKSKGKQLTVPVTHHVPAKLMGSGIGKDNVHRGDYDIQLFDKETVEEYDLSTLKFGDFVAITDADHSYGRIYKQDYISIGVIVHSDCVIAGHGPGVMTVFTGHTKNLKTKINKDSNLYNYLYNE